jgi:hypothetical protein
VFSAALSTARPAGAPAGAGLRPHRARLRPPGTASPARVPLVCGGGCWPTVVTGCGSFAVSFRTPALRTRRPPLVTWPASRRAAGPPSRRRWPQAARRAARPSRAGHPVTEQRSPARALPPVASHAMAQAPPFASDLPRRPSAPVERDEAESSLLPGAAPRCSSQAAGQHPPVGIVEPSTHRGAKWHDVPMANIPPAGPPRGFESRGAVPPGPPPEPVEFTEEQKREIAFALYQAQVELLQAIARSATRADRHYAARSAVRHLTQALATLRATAGQAQSRSPFPPGLPPWMGP